MEFDIKGLLRRYRRVLFITRKPSKDEFTGAGKICLIGIFLIGLIGFGIFLAFTLLLPGV
jgi:protein transport protein SEC61 subunit gamma-like protein